MMVINGVPLVERVMFRKAKCKLVDKFTIVTLSMFFHEYRGNKRI
jgi:hypothetical protein